MCVVIAGFFFVFFLLCHGQTSTKDLRYMGPYICTVDYALANAFFHLEKQLKFL